MSINPKHRIPPSQTAASTLQVPPVQAQAQPARIEHRPASERNGYLDPDQTLVNFCVREMGYSFERIIKEDPNRLLRSWGNSNSKFRTILRRSSDRPNYQKLLSSLGVRLSEPSNFEFGIADIIVNQRMRTELRTGSASVRTVTLSSMRCIRETIQGLRIRFLTIGAKRLNCL